MLKVGLFGLGNVGKNLIKIIREKNLPIEIVAVVDRSYQKKKEILSNIPASDDPTFIFSRPNLDAIVELIGGTETALFAAKETLNRGLPLVTANKALLAEHGYSLISLAQKNHTHIFFEAAVAGAIPIIHELQNVYHWEQITKLEGILNGTTNYILTHMHQDKKDFPEVLKKAQELGLAENDPTLDISGKDAAQKLALLASIVSHRFVDVARIFCRGISEITLNDIIWAEKLNFRFKLLAKAIFDQEISVLVEPTLVGKDHYLYHIQEENNAVFFKGEYSQNHLLVGKGAGGLPTASSVVADLLRLLRKENYPWPNPYHYAKIADIGNLITKFYVRLLVQDEAGVLAQIAEVFHKHRLSIAVLHQEIHNTQPPQAEIVLLTHEAKRLDVTNALKNLTALPQVLSAPSFYPVESQGFFT